jgi:hypothetical protein
MDLRLTLAVLQVSCQEKLGPFFLMEHLLNVNLW